LHTNKQTNQPKTNTHTRIQPISLTTQHVYVVRNPFAWQRQTWGSKLGSCKCLYFEWWLCPLLYIGKYKVVVGGQC
jgi:hypothetical protein